MTLERCCICDEPTSKAGRGDDSLYTEADGKEIGPCCSACLDDVQHEKHKPKKEIKMTQEANLPEKIQPEGSLIDDNQMNRLQTLTVSCHLGTLERRCILAAITEIDRLRSLSSNGELQAWKDLANMSALVLHKYQSIPPQERDDRQKLEQALAVAQKQIKASCDAYEGLVKETTALQLERQEANRKIAGLKEDCIASAKRHVDAEKRIAAFSLEITELMARLYHADHK